MDHLHASVMGLEMGLWFKGGVGVRAWRGYENVFIVRGFRVMLTTMEDIRLRMRYKVSYGVR